MNNSISLSIWLPAVSRGSGSATVQAEGMLCFIMSDINHTIIWGYREEGGHYSTYSTWTTTIMVRHCTSDRM